jgi:hypothetical protein
MLFVILELYAFQKVSVSVSLTFNFATSETASGFNIPVFCGMSYYNEKLSCVWKSSKAVTGGGV